MFKQIVFQIHWFLGITAGIILGIVGITGALQSFEDELLMLANPNVMTISDEQRAGHTKPMALQDLIDRAKEQYSYKKLVNITQSSNPKIAARVGYAWSPESGIKKGFDAEYINQYNGQLLGKARGEGFFSFVMKLHRCIVMGDVGRQITGASTIALFFFCVSGIYMRWPKKVTQWRTWLWFNWRYTGRRFLWDLHSIIGTWCVVMYLLASLTGLYWSYDWYRNTLYTITGVTKPPPKSPPKTGITPAINTDLAAHPLNIIISPEQQITDAATPPNYNLAWAQFLNIAPHFQSATFTLGKNQVDISYLNGNPAHQLATDKITLDAQTGHVIKQDVYAQRPFGQRIMNSIFALHKGTYFGTVGVVLMMLASLFMPLFTITGWMLYLDRRAKKRQLLATKSTFTNNLLHNTLGKDAKAQIVIGYASQTGFAEQIAWRTAALFQQTGMTVQVLPLNQHTFDAIDPNNQNQQLLIVASTFGDGDPPDSATQFIAPIKNNERLKGVHFGVLALGSKQYDAFCQFGKSCETYLLEQGAKAIFDRIDLNNDDPIALETWHQHIIKMANLPPNSGDTFFAQDAMTAFSPFNLVAKTCLNIGSQGLPTYELKLTSPTPITWQAGDLLEVLLPDQTTRRCYSIASCPIEGTINVVIRQIKNGDQYGQASGWLTREVDIGEPIQARIKNHANLHLTPSAAPLILIGNGTGIAVLRAHLKAHIDAGFKQNWLIFGERNAAFDFYYHDQLSAWFKAGYIEQIDAVFSRDSELNPSQNSKPKSRYVQHQLANYSAQIQQWIANDARIVVCGSVVMGKAVDAVLKEMLGEVVVDTLIAQRRYLKDVY